MATIRAAMIAGAALVVLLGTIPAQAQSGPLQLLPGAGQATRTAKGAIPANAASKSTARKTAKKATTAPAKKVVANTAVTKRATASTAVASKAATKKAVASKAVANKAVAKSATTPRSNAPRVAQPKAKNAVRTATAPAQKRARAVHRQPAQQAIATALPEIKRDDRQENQEPLAFAPMPIQQSARPRATRNPAPRNLMSRDQIMRDGDSVSLIARLPWWRNDRLQPIRYGSEESQSQVLEAADAWLLASQTVVTDHDLSDNGAPYVLIADAGEVNALDLASAPAPSTPTFWHSLIAILGGTAAVAAAAMASVRALFA